MPFGAYRGLNFYGFQWLDANHLPGLCQVNWINLLVHSLNRKGITWGSYRWLSSNLEHRKKPLKISNFVGLMREFNYILMCLSSFFLYCTLLHVCPQSDAPK